MKIYFAGSIRGGRKDQKLYAEIIKILGKYGEILTEYIGNPKLSKQGELKKENYIYKRDMAWLKKADVLVAEITTPSLGVGYELGKAEDRIPILCLYRKISGKKISAMIAGNKRLVLSEYQTPADAEEKLKKFFKKFQN